ncbi:Fibroin light chain [Eumeta japonica]|uniref:Fibroin light chain n=1 Tax=Eumeta variegata TaxID=151549 RepID=A0A4C1Y9Z8_EUMVA|nr:Fibroin light chain [Eumeta japonica]
MVHNKENLSYDNVGEHADRELVKDMLILNKKEKVTLQALEQNTSHCTFSKLPRARRVTIYTNSGKKCRIFFRLYTKLFGMQIETEIATEIAARERIHPRHPTSPSPHRASAEALRPEPSICNKEIAVWLSNGIIETLTRYGAEATRVPVCKRRPIFMEERSSSGNHEPEAVGRGQLPTSSNDQVKSRANISYGCVGPFDVQIKFIYSGGLSMAGAKIHKLYIAVYHNPPRWDKDLLPFVCAHCRLFLHIWGSSDVWSCIVYTAVVNNQARSRYNHAAYTIGTPSRCRAYKLEITHQRPHARAPDKSSECNVKEQLAFDLLQSVFGASVGVGIESIHNTPRPSRAGAAGAPVRLAADTAGSRPRLPTVTAGAFELSDGGETNIYTLTIQEIINDLSKQPDAQSQAIAFGTTLAVLGELAAGSSGDACAYANAVDAYVGYLGSGNSAGLRGALGGVVGRLNGAIDSIAGLATNPGSLRYSRGASGGCAGGGRSYQFESAWESVLGSAGINNAGLLNELYCASRRLYNAYNDRSNNVGAAASAAAIAPVAKVVGGAIGPITNLNDDVEIAAHSAMAGLTPIRCNTR